MTVPERPPGSTFPRLVEVMRRLLAPDGCPWDREQTLASLRPFLLEEAYEVLDALEDGTAADHCEELGDLLMQIVFQAALRDRTGEFNIDDVVRSIRDKLVRRHPHVFGSATVEGAAQVVKQWDQIKAEERRAKRSADGIPRVLSNVPRSAPALLRAQKLAERAAAVGFEWPDVAGCRAKVAEELQELDTAIAVGEHAHIESEFGDVLFSLVTMARKLGVDAEAALRGANRRFVARFEHIEDRLHERGKSPQESDLAEMDQLWDEAKKLTQY
jgi:MazG family protein